MAQHEKVLIKSNRFADQVKWFFSILIVVVVGLANSWYGEEFPLLYRFIAASALILLALFVSATTGQGRSFIALIKESRLEIRKVVWPTRHETLVTSGFVVLVVSIFSIALWAIDSVLRIGVSAILG